jgi:hypothetical protein
MLVTVPTSLLTDSFQTCFWNNEILSPIQKHGMLGPGKTAFKKLKILLDRMMLRRTKVRRDHISTCRRIMIAFVVTKGR